MTDRVRVVSPKKPLNPHASNVKTSFCSLATYVNCLNTETFYWQLRN